MITAVSDLLSTRTLIQGVLKDGSTFHSPTLHLVVNVDDVGITDNQSEKLRDPRSEVLPGVREGQKYKNITRDGETSSRPGRTVFTTTH